MTRTNRVWSSTALAACALAAGVALTACSAGQIAETAKIQAAVPGGNANLQVNTQGEQCDGVISVRNATVDYAGPDQYKAGGTAPLSVYLVNATPSAIALVKVDATITYQSTDAKGVLVMDSGSATVVYTSTGPAAAPVTSACGPSAVPALPVPTPAPTTPAGAPASASASANPSASASVTPSPVVTTPPPAGLSSFAIVVPAAPDGFLALTKSEGSYLQLDKLSSPMLPGATVHLVFTFRLGNGALVVVGDDQAQPINAPIGPPVQPAERATVSLSPVA